MSNHDGSYLLNSVLQLLRNHNVFEFLGKDKTLEFMGELRQLSWSHDCNAGEILEDIGMELGICYICWDYGNNLEHGICEACMKD